MSCDMTSRNHGNNSADPDIEQKQGLDNSNSRILEDSKWIHTPYSDYPDCVDTMAFNTDSSGYEYRCEFELSNDFTYTFENDTVVLTEYGLISEIDASLGKEVKGRTKYLKNNNEMILISTAADGLEPFKEMKGEKTSYKKLEN